MEVDHGAFSGVRWQEMDADTRRDLLALRYADLQDANPPDPVADEKAQRAAIRAQFERDAKRAAASDAMRANGSSPEGIAVFLRDMGLD